MTTDTSPLLIFPHMCQQQCQDLDILLHALDDFGATALALSGNSAQGYACFIEARDNIRKLVVDTAKNYRMVA